jgi:uncharacterized membrane protein YeaQ/YmgE (transglycosylase-associated protein family)
LYNNKITIESTIEYTIVNKGGDTNMGLILMLILGAVAGWLASVVMRSPNGLLMDMVLGIVGSFVGGFVMNLLGQPGFTGFNLYGLLVSFIGAVLVIYIGRLLTRNRVI